MKSTEIWDKSLQLIKEAVGEGIFDLWFNPIKVAEIDGDTFMLEVPNRFFKEWIEDYHPTLITETLEKVSSIRYNLKYNISSSSKEDEALKRADVKLENRKTRLARKGIYINPKYTFDSFVVGQSNQFAHAAAMRVSENPGKVYNPLFIYGGVGLGKTHLVSAIGNKTIDLKRHYNVLYINSEQFTNEVVSAIRHQKTEDLKQKYRTLDMLLIDDIQFIENKPSTQDELFHTLNSLYEAHKQIVISSDRSPKEIRQITDRLRSRFSMGLIADIQPPEVETKVAIIQKKAEADRIVLPSDVIYYIAAKIKSNIRDIEGSLIKLGAHSSLTGAPITLEMARNLLRDTVGDDEKPLSLEQIARMVAEHFGLKVSDLKAKKRTKDIAMPRQLAMFISRELTESSLNEIGKHLGGKDHATVIYAHKQVTLRRQKDESFDRMVEALMNKIRP